MGVYEDRILPHLINLAMRKRDLMPYRERTISASEGRVLEVGVGSGLNLPLYDTNVDEILGLDPSPQLIEMAGRNARRASRPITFIEGSAEAIPLDSGSVDTVVTTWTLCSIPHAQTALEEMRRVLKPGGQLLFVEHGEAPEVNVRWWQDTLNPCWKRIGGGCNLNRPIGTLIETSGFHITGIDTGYSKGPKPMVYMYEGRARPS